MKRRILSVLLCAAMTAQGIPAHVQAREAENENKLEKEEKINSDEAKKIVTEQYDIELVDTSIPTYFDDGDVVSNGTTHGSNYNSMEKGYVTAIKNQSPWGTCWSFATVSAIETSLIKDYPEKYNRYTTDLSEYMLDYFSYHTGYDELGRTNDDTWELSGSDPVFLDVGGNALNASYVLMHWQGLADESKYPYPTSNVAGKENNGYYTIDKKEAQNDTVHLENSYWLQVASAGGEENRDAVKKMIKDYGSVVWSYYHSDSYENWTNGAYYLNVANTGTNHSITVVGWDDDYSKENFNESVRPENDGAWIIKNSWGDKVGDGGYYYISYEDKSLGSGNSKAVALQAAPADKYDNNYFNSNSGMVSYSGNVNKMASVFTTGDNGREKLGAVSFMMASTDSEYTLKIYKNLSKNSDGIVTDPTSGTLCTEQTGITNYVGIYTVELDNPVEFDKNTTFSVVIEFNDEESVYFDTSYSSERSINNQKYTFKSTVNSHVGESFVYTKSYGRWDDAYEHYNNMKSTMCINALTTDCEGGEPEELHGTFEIDDDIIFSAYRLYSLLGVYRGLDTEGAEAYIVQYDKNDKVLAETKISCDQSTDDKYKYDFEAFMDVTLSNDTTQVCVKVIESVDGDDVISYSPKYQRDSFPKDIDFEIVEKDVSSSLLSIAFKIKGNWNYRVHTKYNIDFSYGTDTDEENWTNVHKEVMFSNSNNQYDNTRVSICSYGGLTPETTYYGKFRIYEVYTDINDEKQYPYEKIINIGEFTTTEDNDIELDKIFEDENLLKLVQISIDKTENDVKQSDLDSVTSLSYSYNSDDKKAIRSLAGIESLKNLEEIYIIYNEIEDVSKIDWDKLDKLKSINLKGNNISKVFDTSGCERLKSIELSENMLNQDDMDEIKRLAQLKDKFVSVWGLDQRADGLQFIVPETIYNYGSVVPVFVRSQGYKKSNQYTVTYMIDGDKVKMTPYNANMYSSWVSHVWDTGLDEGQHEITISIYDKKSSKIYWEDTQKFTVETENEGFAGKDQVIERDKTSYLTLYSFLEGKPENVYIIDSNDNVVGTSEDIDEYDAWSDVRYPEFTTTGKGLFIEEPFFYCIDADISVSWNKVNDGIYDCKVVYADGREFVIEDAVELISGGTVDFTGISIASNPKKTKYYVGESFDPSGLEIYEEYSDGSQEKVKYDDKKSDFTFSIDRPLTAEDDTVTVTYKKAIADIDIEVVAAENRRKLTVSAKGGTVVYGDVYTPSVEAIDEKGESVNFSSDKLSYKYFNDKNEELSQAPVNAGEYWVQAFFAGSDDYDASESDKVRLTIQKKKVTVMVVPENSTVEPSDSVVKYEIKTEGFVGNDQFIKVPVVVVENGVTYEEGTYKLNISGAEAGENYIIEYIPAVITVKIIENAEEKERPKITAAGVTFPNKKDTYSVVYTGYRICPAMKVNYIYQENGKQKTVALKLNQDYVVTYLNNLNAGTGTVTIRGIGGYTGTVQNKFSITPKSIAKATISNVGDILYGQKPVVAVTDGNLELVQGDDYVIEYNKGNEASDTVSELQVKAKSGGNYTGEISKKVKFNILSKNTLVESIEDAEVTFKKVQEYTYTGKAVKPAVNVMLNGKKLSASQFKVVYTNNINAGTATVQIVGVSKKNKGYYGVANTVLTYEINPKDFGKVKLKGSTNFPINSNMNNIDISFKDGNCELARNKDYVIDYSTVAGSDGKLKSDIKAGQKYEVTIKALSGGNYVGNTVKKVKIAFTKLNLAEKTANVSVNITDANANKVTLTYNGVTLIQDTDYNAKVKYNKKTDTYTVTVSATKASAYKGSRTFKSVTL